MNTRTKIILGFVYSLISAYFIIYKFVHQGFYYIQSGGGDWGYLAVILGWLLFSIASFPLIVVFKNVMKITSGSPARRYFYIMVTPTVFGTLVLLTLTITGRMIYKPLYEKKHIEIQNTVNVTPIRISVNSPAYDPTCSCTRASTNGLIDIVNAAPFPVEFQIRSSGSAVCQTGTEFRYRTLVEKGNFSKAFTCFYNPSDVFDKESVMKENFILTFREKNNDGVTVEKLFRVSEFRESAGFR